MHRIGVIGDEDVERGAVRLDDDLGTHPVLRRMLGRADEVLSIGVEGDEAELGDGARGDHRRRVDRQRASPVRVAVTGSE